MVTEDTFDYILAQQFFKYEKMYGVRENLN